MYADLNYYRKTEKKKRNPVVSTLKVGAILFIAAYMLVKVVEPILVSGIY